MCALLDQVMAGRPAVALIAGEAGVGKSRLVGELSRIAAERGARVLGGGCVELGGEGIPLAPLVDLLRALARTTPAEALDRLLGPARQEFARLLPELDPTVAAGPVAEASATQLLEHVLGLITRLAAQRPLLLVVEDLHWADRSTRDLVAFLAQTLRELGVLLLLTYRSDELHRRHPLRLLITGWERVRTVHRVELGRFSRSEVAAQCGAIRDTAPSAQFAEVVFERSQGNAFLVEEILAAVDSGADPGELPPSLRDMLLARTETVSEAAQRVLRAASAAGPRVEDRLLEAVAGMPEAQLYPALREAVEHHLLVVDGDGSGYAFRHELTRDAVYDDMLPGERVRLHATYGEALAGDPTLLGEDGNVAATLAHHWYAAMDLPRALGASVAAGRQAAAAFAPAEAQRHLERALRIWPRVPDAADRAGMDWLGINLLAADAVWTAGEPSRGLSIVDDMLADDGAAGDPVRRAQVVERRAYMLRALGRDDEAAGQLREALALLPAAPVTTTHAVVLASLANSLGRADELGQARDVARAAVDAAAAVGATPQHADALITLGISAVYLGEAPAGLAAMRDGLALAERHGLLDVALRGYINLSDGLEMLGQHTEAAETARSGIALANRLGRKRSFGALLVGNLAESLMRPGRWGEALSLITGSLADGPTGIFASTVLLQRAELSMWQGDAPAAADDVREARRQFGDGLDTQYTAPMAFIEAELARASGDTATAWQHIRTALNRPFSATAMRYAWPLVWLGMRVQADIASASGPVASGAAASGGAASGGAASGGTATVCRRRDSLRTLAAAIPALAPPAVAYRALTAAETARLNRCGEVAAWREAVETTRAAGEAFPMCYALYRLAEAQCGAAWLDAGGTTGPDAGGAAATARECLRLANDLAASTAPDLRALIRRARLRVEPAAPAVTAGTGSHRLTDRELEVLALVAEGHSNGKIASALFISPKTASVHVSNILTKLGASSRTEAATAAHRHGLLPAG
ncbi:LuxR family transcriptional regulator [Rugosimonospora acidiphila]|uniref:LuxR family transcriptional regulator n=1 Tax=Rugosimonospora acidiphila TaxID=556531 RepID=A0ABP9S2P7_9ACTN